MLIQLQDGTINEIKTYTDSEGGCESCDYGSSYINEFTVYLSNGRIEVRVDTMYHHALSEDFLMKLFLPNVDFIKELTLKGFHDWLRDAFSSVLEDNDQWSLNKPEKWTFEWLDKNE